MKDAVISTEYTSHSLLVNSSALLKSSTQQPAVVCGLTCKAAPRYRSLRARIPQIEMKSMHHLVVITFLVWVGSISSWATNPTAAISLPEPITIILDKSMIALRDKLQQIPVGITGGQYGTDLSRTPAEFLARFGPAAKTVVETRKPVELSSYLSASTSRPLAAKTEVRAFSLQLIRKVNLDFDKVTGGPSPVVEPGGFAVQILIGLPTKPIRSQSKKVTLVRTSYSMNDVVAGVAFNFADNENHPGLEAFVLKAFDDTVLSLEVELAKFNRVAP